MANLDFFVQLAERLESSAQGIRQALEAQDEARFESLRVQRLAELAELRRSLPDTHQPGTLLTGGTSGLRTLMAQALREESLMLDRLLQERNALAQELEALDVTRQNVHRLTDAYELLETPQ